LTGIDADRALNFNTPGTRHGIHQSPDAVDRDDRIIFDAQRNAIFYDRDGSANRYDADKFAVVYDKVTADDFIIV
jgi:hypothetical protein